MASGGVGRTRFIARRHLRRRGRYGLHIRRAHVRRHGQLLEQQAEERDERNPATMAVTTKQHRSDEFSGETST
jgi:hypothetical protein